MIQSEHVRREELVALLDSSLSEEKTNLIEDHLQSCEHCRAEMDQLAARSEIWQKAPRLLRPSSDSSNVLNLGSGELETRELSPSKSESGESALGFQSENLLESPKHPEMLGSIGRYDVEREIGRAAWGLSSKPTTPN